MEQGAQRRRRSCRVRALKPQTGRSGCRAQPGTRSWGSRVRVSEGGHKTPCTPVVPRRDGHQAEKKVLCRKMGSRLLNLTTLFYFLGKSGIRKTLVWALSSPSGKQMVGFQSKRPSLETGVRHPGHDCRRGP